jgi:hypothetical protein
MKQVENIENKNQKSKPNPLIGIIFIIFIIFLISNLVKSSKVVSEVTKTKITPTTTIEPTKPEVRAEATKEPEIPTPTVTPQTTNPEDLFSEIGNKYAGDDGRVSSIKKGDGEWIVTIVINSWPEIMGEFGAKTWGRNFIYDVYHSGISIKMAGVTVNSPKSIDKYLRVFVGSNYAKKLSDDDWKYLMPTNFYRWVTDNETSRNVNDAEKMVIESNFKLY